jgi:hypothetical protein
MIDEARLMELLSSLSLPRLIKKQAVTMKHRVKRNSSTLKFETHLTLSASHMYT